MSQKLSLLARRGLCYSTLALITDFDCWHIEEEAVTLEAVLEIMHKNVDRAQKVINELVPMLENIGPWVVLKLASMRWLRTQKKFQKNLKKMFLSYLAE
ncbi:MAG: hypothetical protein CM1200mP16_12780 [Nitrospina sp.]|nr:MAG: hypothetical protein CM1200mP16_12780 [Nitrospina sp.]